MCEIYLLVVIHFKCVALLLRLSPEGKYNTVSNQSLQWVSAMPQSTLDKSSRQYNLFGDHTCDQVHEFMLGAVQYSTVQYSTVKYSSVQCSTVQYSSVQYSTVEFTNGGRLSSQLVSERPLLRWRVLTSADTSTGVRTSTGVKLAVSINIIKT